MLAAGPAQSGSVEEATHECRNLEPFLEGAAELAGRRDRDPLSDRASARSASETSEKVGQVAGAGVSLAIGSLLALAALLVLLDAAAAYLRDVVLLTPWVAHLAVGLVVALIALVFILKGRSNLKAGNLTPDRTIASLQQDAVTVGERV